MVLFIGFFDITIVLFSMFALQNRVYFHLIAVAGSSSNAVTDLLKVLLRKNTLLIARDSYCSPRANKLKKLMEDFSMNLSLQFQAPVSQTLSSEHL